MPKLLPRRERFVKEYLIDRNATQAAIRSGYSKKTARAIGSRLLTDVDIRARVDELIREQERRTLVTADEVILELKRLGFSNMLDFGRVNDEGDLVLDMSTLTREQAAAIQSVDVETYTEGKGEDARPVKRVRLKLADKKGPLELLGKHLKLFNDSGERVTSLLDAINESLRRGQSKAA